MQIITKTKHAVTIQMAGEQVLFFNKFGVAYETMMDEALNGKTAPKWKKVELTDGKTESLLADFLLTAGATRQHNGREYVYDFSGIEV